MGWREVGPLTFLELSMIGNWKRFKIFLNVIQVKRVVIDQEGLLLMRESQDGRFLVKLFYLTLGQISSTHFPITLFGTLGSPPRLDFLLGKPRGVKF